MQRSGNSMGESMVTYAEVYNKLLTATLDQNHTDLTLNLTDDLTKKLVSWGKRHGVPYNLVKYSFNTDETFRSNFIKDPKKQNISSVAFFQFAELHLGVGNITMLPNGGTGALYCLGGKVLPFSEVRTVRKSAKTIDFVVKLTGDRKLFISHKRTDGASGGAQDNQKNDAEAFLDQVRNNNDPHQLFAAVLDGDYYTARIPGIRANFYRENKIYVCNSDELVGVVNQLGV